MKVFLVSPYKIDNDFLKKKSIIKSIFLENEIELLLAEDSKTNESLSVKATIELFNQSDYFIIDLSLERPSCYYELGYLQAQNKKIFMIARSDETIHQLLNRDEIMFFSDLNEYERLIKKIVLTIKNGRKCQN